MSYGKKLASGNGHGNAAALLDVYKSLKTSSTPATKVVARDGGSGLLKHGDKSQKEGGGETAKEKDLSAASVQPRTGAVRVSDSVSSLEKSKSSNLNVARKKWRMFLPSSPKAGSRGRNRKRKP